MDEGVLNRARTDAVIAFLNGSDYDFGPYLDLAKQAPPGGMDAALAALMQQQPSDQPYRLRDLNSPLPMAVISSNLLAGHPKVSTSPTEDWPMADAENPYGEHHPLSMKSGCCPLLHGGQHGEPEYAHHIISTIPLLQDMKEKEVLIGRNLDKERYGHPIEHMHDLFQRHRAEDAFMDEGEWTERKRAELMNSFGMLPYLFGLEWSRPEQREAFVDLLVQANAATDEASRKVILNKMQERAGLSWGRAQRSWMSRFPPMAEWWGRPSDRHGTINHAGLSPEDDHFMGAWSEDGSPSMNHHWWEPFLYWGGVGRGSDSLMETFRQSYPEMFTQGGWSEGTLIEPVMQALSMSRASSSHYPILARDRNVETVNPETVAAIHGGPSDDFTRKRGNWSSVANHAHLHPSEIKGSSHQRMQVPSDALLMSSLGRAIVSHTETGRQKKGIYREEHPTSTRAYWGIHNPHFETTDRFLGDMIGNTAQQVMEQFGPEVLTGTDPQSNTIARGNLQQIAAAVNHAAMRTQMGPKYKVMAGMQMQPLSPVNPNSHATMPPVYVSGNNDVWGHEMPATLAWRFDPESGLRFDVKDTPFTTMQRTVHSGHIPLPSMMDVEMLPKQNDVYAMSAVNPQGLSHLVSGDLQKADDYEPTGVFKTLIQPAHTIYDLEDLDTLKGFSGDWVVQSVPSGKRMLIEKKGRKVTPANLNEKVKDDLRKLSGDCTFDAYVDGKVMTAIDLLVHKGSDLHMEPLEDRLNALRTLYDSTEHMIFPSPVNCNLADNEGLVKTADSMRDGELLIRDAKSTFMKGREVHPKWVRLVEKDTVKKHFPTLPQVVVRGNRLELHYPEIVEPVVVKGEMQDEGFVVEGYEGSPALIKHALRQKDLWGPLGVALLKEGAAAAAPAGGGGGTVTSSTPGTHSPLHSERRRRRPRRHLTVKSAVLRAPAISGDDGKPEEVENVMRHARRYISDKEVSMTTEEMCDGVKGLSPKMLETYGPEYGVEEKDGKWTVNEAIDDDIVERFMYPRMNSASPDGGAWSGMQADLTAPRGPTELTEESGTTFADGRSVEEDEEREETPSLQMRIDRGLMGDEATLEVEGHRAVLRYPKRSLEEEQDEQEVDPTTRSEAERVA